MPLILTGTLIAIVLIAVTIVLIWGVKDLVYWMVTGERTLHVRSPVYKEETKMIVTPSTPIEKGGPPKLGDYEPFTLSLSPTGQMIKDQAACTVWNHNYTKSYSFTTPGIAMHAESTAQSPKCVLNITGGSKSLLSSGLPDCVAQPDKPNWFNPLIPSAGGVVKGISKDTVNSLDRCVVELNPSQFDSFAAFDYAVANAGSVLASGSLEKTVTLDTKVSGLTNNTTQLVTLTQDIAATDANVQQLSAQIKAKEAANAALAEVYAEKINEKNRVEIEGLKALESELITVKTQVSASNVYLDQLKKELEDLQLTSSNLNAEYVRAKKKKDRAESALAQFRAGN